MLKKYLMYSFETNKMRGQPFFHKKPRVLENSMNFKFEPDPRVHVPGDRSERIYIVNLGLRELSFLPNINDPLIVRHSPFSLDFFVCSGCVFIFAILKSFKSLTNSNEDNKK